jgi:hypothetical protein
MGKTLVGGLALEKEEREATQFGQLQPSSVQCQNRFRTVSTQLNVALFLFAGIQ